jgi:hypothetical protein
MPEAQLGVTNGKDSGNSSGRWHGFERLVNMIGRGVDRWSWDDGRDGKRNNFSVTADSCWRVWGISAF